MNKIILGLPEMVFWLWLSATFYTIASVLFLSHLRKEKNELMYAFFAFLVGMGVFHIFLGAGFYWNSHILIHIGMAAALIGSAFTLKFPFSALINPEKPSLMRLALFYLAITIAILTAIWLLIADHPDKIMLDLTFGYMIIATGSIAGTYVIWKGFKQEKTWAKVKSVGGGAGMVICCFIADVLVLTQGVSVAGEILMAIAPVVLISSFYLGGYLQKKSKYIDTSRL
ncbi:MAG: hypothetical protein Q7R75_02020 [bacterium]|nr:hypothetical protein [bacterium]